MKEYSMNLNNTHENHRDNWCGSYRQSIRQTTVEIRFPYDISNSRGPSSLASLVINLGPEAKAGTTHEAAQAEIVILAVQWSHVVQALTNLPSWNGDIVIDLQILVFILIQI